MKITYVRRPQTVRERKGKSLLLFTDDYTIIDIETTDFDYYYGDIIEIAAHKYRSNILVDKFQSLINIEYKLDDSIIELTGITDAMLETAPALKTVLELFIDFIGEDILVAHNANFDLNFIYDSLLANNLPSLNNDFIDTLRIARRLVRDSKDHKLSTLARHFDISIPNHRADDDCIATNGLLDILRTLSKSNPNWNMNKSRVREKIDFTKITSETSIEDIDENNHFFGKNVCFTGKMNIFSKTTAAQIIANLGARIQNNVIVTTDILVLGDLDYQQSHYGGKSNKHLKAEGLIENGSNIELMTEITFLGILESE